MIEKDTSRHDNKRLIQKRRKRKRKIKTMKSQSSQEPLNTGCRDSKNKAENKKEMIEEK